MYHGSTDGNPNTEEMVKAISQFQKAYGLIETGTLNSLTINKLNSGEISKEEYEELVKSYSNTEAKEYRFNEENIRKIVS